MKVIYKDDKNTFRAFLNSYQYQIVNNKIILPKNYYSMEYVQTIFPGSNWSSFPKCKESYKTDNNIIVNYDIDTDIDYFLDNCL